MTCENCRALYARIAAANRLALASKPVVDDLRVCREKGYPYLREFTADQLMPLLHAFDSYAASELDARIDEARTDEPAPQTLRAIDADVDEIVERSR